jgi:hypothetical protein
LFEEILQQDETGAAIPPSVARLEEQGQPYQIRADVALRAFKHLYLKLQIRHIFKYTCLS